MNDITSHASAEPALNRPVTIATTPDDLVRLLARVARRDRAAFAQLYAATSAKLYGVILRILRRRDLADEILQEVYVKIWEHAGSYVPGRASPISWMAAIARNRALDEVRRKSPLALEDMPAGFEVADTLPLASETMERAKSCSGFWLVSIAWSRRKPKSSNWPICLVCRAMISPPVLAIPRPPSRPGCTAASSSSRIAWAHDRTR